jgi:TonB family protein
MKTSREHRDVFRAVFASAALHAVLAGALVLSVSFTAPNFLRRDEAPRVLHVSWVSAERETSAAVERTRKDEARPLNASATSLPARPRDMRDRPAAPLREAPQRAEIQTVSLSLPVGVDSGGGRQDAGPAGAPQTSTVERTAGREPIASATPRYRENTHPVYPAVARSRGYEGMVLLAAEVAADGRVEKVAIKKSSGYASLDRSALESVKRWKFDPGRKLGKPVAMWVDVPVKFVLKEDDSIS